jgi:regulator of RNase E activity RraA
MIRDCQKIIALGFPVFYQGIRPLDSKGRGRVMAYDVPIRCGEVLVRPGELIFTDYDGIVVVPPEVEAKVLRQAEEKIGKENDSRRELLNGRSLKEVYAKYHVL